ncbi:unnamed protein product [Amoebophrya sp. A25]|nr:unnamed protein product [Amoebophrya sp. A25]|eukprot:GSA25T00025904001.1
MASMIVGLQDTGRIKQEESSTRREDDAALCKKVRLVFLKEYMGFFLTRKRLEQQRTSAALSEQQDSGIFPVLQPGDIIAGPAWVLDKTTTCVLDAACTAKVLPDGSLDITVLPDSSSGTKSTATTKGTKNGTTTPTTNSAGAATSLQDSILAWRKYLSAPSRLPEAFDPSGKPLKNGEASASRDERRPGVQLPSSPSSRLHKSRRKHEHLSSDPEPPPTGPDPASLSVYGHRFMSVAEQAGRVLQRTAVSVNIKERLDFSCAIFSADGGLVANAPHVPVHLGAMAETVKAQLCIRREELRSILSSSTKNDTQRDIQLAWVTNDPFAGGSHLPDVTVITPVFVNNSTSMMSSSKSNETQTGEQRELLFFVANRGHHADIGGIAAGSMPSNSTLLSQEGSLLRSEILVSEGGEFQEPRMRELFSTSRNLEDVVSDLKAQVAANHKAKALLLEMLNDRGRRTVLNYMEWVQQHARRCVEAMLLQMCKKFGRTTFGAEDCMDCGTKIKLKVSILTTNEDTTTEGPELKRQRRIQDEELVNENDGMSGHEKKLLGMENNITQVDSSAPQSSHLPTTASSKNENNPSTRKNIPRSAATASNKNNPSTSTHNQSLATTQNQGQGQVRAIFDFSGTGGERPESNINAPKAITSAAIMYCLRCLVRMDIPLNSGCLLPVEIKLPEKSLLNPTPGLAVCAGNVTTSMRVTDVILKAFHAQAASQGCMNNLSFGISAEDASAKRFGYYETIAGGSGAGPTWHGTSGKHAHMTNTRMTDVEVLESSYPVVVRKFGLRPNSGGHGKYRGGDGVIRELEFLQDGIELSLLTQRRSTRPFGLAGGGDGQSGKQMLISTTKNTRVLSGCERVENIKAGSVLRIETPGGGGYGVRADSPIGEDKSQLHSPTRQPARTNSIALSSSNVEF